MRDIAEVTLILTTGEKVVMRRCGALPDLFASRDGDLFLIQGLRKMKINDQANIRYRGRMMAARYLVADAWKPGWEDQFRALTVLNRHHPMDTSIENLGFSKDARRGKPRSGEIQERANFARIAVQCRDLNLAAEETGRSPNELFDAVFEWWPEELVDMEGLPEKFVQSQTYKDLVATREARQTARKRRRAKDKQIVKDRIDENSTAIREGYEFSTDEETGYAVLDESNEGGE